jgi:hypothetical protein
MQMMSSRSYCLSPSQMAVSRSIITPRWQDLENDNIRAGLTAVLAVLQCAATGTNLLTGGPGIGAAAPASQTSQLQPPGVFFSVWALLYSGVFVFAVWQWRERATALARATSGPAALSFFFLMVWSLLASGSRTPNAAAVQVALLCIILAVDVPLFLAVRAASAPATLQPAQLLCCAAPLSLLLGWLAVATVLLLSTVAQLCGASALSLASTDQAAPAALTAAVAVAAAWLLSALGPLPGNFFFAGTIAFGLSGSAVSAHRASKPVLQGVAIAAVVLIVAAAAAGTSHPPKWGWASTGALMASALLRSAVTGGGGGQAEEAQPLVSERAP